jgi:hypothetical protein
VGSAWTKTGNDGGLTLFWMWMLDEFVKRKKYPNGIIPAKAGIQAS